MTKLANKQKVAFLRQMLRIRSFEERLYQLYTEGRVPGMSPHLSVGQEASAVGVCAALRPDDYLLTTHRGHGHLLAKGADMKRMLAEIKGKATGYCKGRGGSMHIADVSLGILGANGIVGGGLPIALGAALTSKFEKNGRVTVCFFGDAACNIGSFHESLNMSTIWRLPVVWVCENNQYGLSTPIRKMLSCQTIAQRAAAYCMPGERVDGNDVEAVCSVAVEAVKRARSGEGPSLIECDTYRWYGHGASDNRSYRTRDEEEEWKKRCPIARWRTRVIEDGLLTDREAEELARQATQEVEGAIQFAEESPPPDPAGVADYVD